MKILPSILFCFAFIMCSCFSSKSLVNNSLLKDFIKLNPRDTIYYSKYEVTNKEYKEFLNSIKSENYDLYSRCYVRSSNWLNDIEGSPNQAYKRNYFSNSEFDNYPVLNIPFEGALEYCNWLNKKFEGTQYSFRLPSKTEFLSLLSTVDIKYDSDDPKDYSEFKFNLRFEDDFAIDGGLYTIPVNKSLDEKNSGQNRQGVYNIVGNVHEMLSSGQYIGGSWYSFPSEVAEANKLTKSDSRIGFRLVMIEANR